MIRTTILGAALALAFAAGTGREVYAQEKSEHHKMSLKSAKNCGDCANACNEGFHHCLQQLVAGKKEYAKAAHLCCDTAEICGTAAALCARMSPLMGICCDACARCCDECITECEKLNDPGMKGVIDNCRKTAKSCRDMVKAMGGSGR